MATTELLTVKETAALLRLSPMTVYRLIDAGTIPATRLGRQYRIPATAVDAFTKGETHVPNHDH